MEGQKGNPLHLVPPLVVLVICKIFLFPRFLDSDPSRRSIQQCRHIRRNGECSKICPARPTCTHTRARGRWRSRKQVPEKFRHSCARCIALSSPDVDHDSKIMPKRFCVPLFRDTICHSLTCRFLSLPLVSLCLSLGLMVSEILKSISKLRPSLVEGAPKQVLLLVPSKGCLRLVAKKRPFASG